MSDATNPKVPRVVTGGHATPLGATSRIDSTHTGEMVIALCGPIGSPLHRVADEIKKQLTDDFAYERCEIIKLSHIIEEYAGNAPAGPRFVRTKALIDKGNELRAKYGSSVLAELVVGQVSIERGKEKANAEKKQGAPIPHLTRRVCHVVDSIKNQEELDILKLVYRDMLYFVGVYAPLSSRVKTLEKRGMTRTEIFQLIDQDSGEEVPYGQTVRDTFPQADCFLRIDSDTDAQLALRVQRLLRLILGTKVLTPTPSETAMYLAASAAGNSACLSRQVGAAITDSSGDILAVGWNDVPKYGGSVYMAESTDSHSENDRRCWNLEGGVCFNDREKFTISELVIHDLVELGLLEKKNAKRAVNAIVDNSKIGDLIEFSRSIHAEMLAILAAGQLAGDRLRGGKLFCTTYPCHSCARHIIAAGISEVYYIEPYRKSLATKLHDDAITEDENDTQKVRILPYDGVAPTRYLRFFRVPQNSRKDNGKMIHIDPKVAMPRFEKTLEALPTLEALILKGLEEKQLLKGVVGHAESE